MMTTMSESQDCQSINKCKSLLNIIESLKYHSENLNDNANLKSIHQYFNNDDNSVNIVTDYHHILKYHLNNITKQDNDKNFEYIYKQKFFYGWWIVLATSLIHLWGAGTFFYSFTAFFNPIVNEYGNR